MLRPKPIEEIPADTARVAKAAFRKGSTVMKLRDEFGTLYQDEDFAMLFSSTGQPALAPWRLALITVFQFLENLTDRQAADAVRGRLDWKYALSLELEDPGFDFSVLSEFRTRLVENGLEGFLLEKMLEHFKARGLVKAGGKQRTDATHVVASVRILNLLELYGETLRATLNELAGVAPEWLRGVAQPQWYERYSRRVEEYRLAKSKTARNDYACLVARDGYTLLDALEQAPAALRELGSVKVLQLAWTQHFERKEGVVRWRDPKELPPVGERFESPYDIEAHYSDKRGMSWTGYKVHLTETCDSEAVHLITHVETCYAMVPEVSSTATIHEALAKKGLTPGEHFVDTGYTDAELLVQSQEDYGTKVVGPVRADVSWQAREGAFDASQFTVDWLKQKVTCPQGNEATTWKPTKDAFGADIIAVQFSRTDCRTCLARQLCTRAKNAPRHMVLKPEAQYQALQIARQQQETPEWRQHYHVRAGIEGTLSQGIRSFGLREARYRGLAKTTLQHVITAAAMNVERVTAWLYGTPHAKTRTSSFAALRA